MRFDDLNWFDIEAYLEKDDRVMLVIGSCEQHAYLSLLTDVKIPLALADAASTKSGVLVAPTLNFGSSPYFLSYPGTISLRDGTLLDVLEDIVRSIYSHGFHRILVVNGHGGNHPVKTRLYELANDLPGAQFAWYEWWLSHSVEQIIIKHDLKPAHANWFEAFSFTRVSELPDDVKNPPRIPGLLSSKQARAFYGDGSFGGPYYVDDRVMEEIFSAALADVINLLNFN